MEPPKDERERIAALKELVDGTADKITSGEIDIDAANQLIEDTRKKASELIPEDMDKFDLIYGARFLRLIDQYMTPEEASE